MVEVMTSYKETEIGSIPTDWAVRPLSDVTVADGLVRGPFGGALKKEIFVRNGYSVYEQRNAINCNTDSFRYFIDENKFNELRRFKVGEGDFIVSCAGTIGQICRIGQHSPEGVINQALLKITVDPEIIHPDFFLRVFRSPSFQDRITENSHGGAMKNLVGMDVFREVGIPLPRYEEQRAIAEALSDVDALIERLDALIAKKRAVKTATMQQLLTGQQRLPGFEGAWETRRLGEILSVQHGKSQHQVAQQGGKYPILATSGEIGKASDFLYDKPSVLIGRKGTINKPQFMDKPFWTIDTLFYTKLSDAVEPRFVYYKFCMINWLSHNEASGVPSLNSATVENIQIEVPSFEEQQAIATVLSDMDAEIEALEARRDKTQNIKQGMMQELLTGRTRLV